MTTKQQNIVAQAVAQLRSGESEQARGLFQQLLDADPEQVEALHFLGVLDFQRGDAMAAIERISRALQINPNYVDAYINLGNILFNQGHLTEGYACCLKAYELAPARFDVLENLGVYSRYYGEPQASVSLLQQAVKLRPKIPAAHYNLGNSQTGVGQFDEALESYQRCLALDPEFGPALSVFSRAAYRAGKPEVSSEYYRRILKRDPDNALVLHMLAASSGENVPERCTPESVRQLFDRHAESFDRNLAALGYAGPALLAEILKTKAPPPQSLRVLDACCGTGLCAPVVRPYADQLDGVDLSAGMLEMAQQLNTYDTLHEADIVSYTRDATAQYDLIVCMDAFIYFGRLDEVVPALVSALAEGGLLVFTLEQSDTERGEADYHLGMHGRYQHPRRSVESLAPVLPGCQITIEACVVRQELGADVNGWLCTIEK